MSLLQLRKHWSEAIRLKLRAKRLEKLRRRKKTGVKYKLHFIHVGKCGGESAVRKIGSTGALGVHDEDWFLYHVSDSDERIAHRILNAEDNDFFIVMVRDPVTRFKSAFEWDYFEKIVSRPDIKPGARLKSIYDHFNSANELAEALTDPNDVRRQQAHYALNSSRMHITLDLGWYLPPHIAFRLPEEMTAAIRTEHLEQDVQSLLEILGVTIAPTKQKIVAKSGYQNQIPEIMRSTPLSDLAIENIRNFSADSYSTIGILKRKGLLPHDYISHSN